MVVKYVNASLNTTTFTERYSDMMDNYEEATAFLGQWGRFQQINFILLCASAVLNGLTVFIVVFMAATPRHNCLIPDVNLTREWISAAIPTEVNFRCENIVHK